MKKIILIIGCAIVLFGCNDALEELPSKQENIRPTSIEHLNSLFSNSLSKESKGSIIYLMGDDFTPRQEIQERNESAYTEDNEHPAIAWDMKTMAGFKYSSAIWNKEYEKILSANTVLEYLSKVKGSEEEKQRTKVDALFIRALAHYNLILVYSLPYKKTSAGTDLGIPIKENTRLDDIPNRASVQKVYDFILNDLKEVEEIIEEYDLILQDKENVMQWRASLSALYTLQAKVYLSMGEFPLAKKSVENAYSNLGGESLVDYNMEMSFLDSSPEVEVYYEEDVPTLETINYPITKGPNFKYFDWKENLYVEWISEKFWLVPSEDLQSLYGNQDNRNLDLRWKYNFADNYSFIDVNFQGGYNYDDEFVEPVKIPSYVGISKSGLNVGDLYLIKAECHARTGEFTLAEETVNELRRKRFDLSAPQAIVDLKFDDKDDAIKKILDERRREMPFYTRWHDLKRIAGYEEWSYIPSTISRNFFEYSLYEIDTYAPQVVEFSPQDDYLKFAYPIPLESINTASQVGVDMQQNTY